MKELKTLKRFESVAETWLVALDQYSEEDFARKPDNDAWSIGQVVVHLVVGTNRFHLQKIAQCLDGKGKDLKGGKTFPGRVVFLIGGFPPARIKVPASEATTPKPPRSIAEMKDGLRALIQTMRDTSSKVGSASPVMKAQHPALGYLNAQEWFSLIEMHFRHHLRQKQKLDQFLGKK